MGNLVSEKIINKPNPIVFGNNLNNWMCNFEEANQKKHDVILDTSSVNKIIKDEYLLNKFFKKIHKRNYRVVIPYEAFSELSNDDMILQRLKDLIKERRVDIRIGEPVFVRIGREINEPITSNSYFKGGIDIFKIAIEFFEANKKHNKKRKKGWIDNGNKLQKKILRDFNIISTKERNKKIEEILEKDDFLINYEKDKSYWVLNFLENYYKIKLPKDNICSNKNRYKFINILQCLMFINIYRSSLSGKSKWAINRGDLFDMEIAAFSAYSSCFISEDKCLINCLKKIKNNSDELGFENQYKIYDGIETFENLKI